jgi:hypothetical protein
MLSILDFRLSFGTSFFLKPSLFDNHEIKTDYFYLLVFVGFCGGIVGTPADMINVRMQNDMKLPVDQRRKYLISSSCWKFAVVLIKTLC